MNWFRNRNQNYPLSDEEAARGRAKAVTALMFAVLGSVVVITAAHAILLVLYTTSDFANTGDGILYTFLNVIRVSFPVVVEVAAVAIALGFITSAWREGQRTLGTFLEVTWILFAAANMITFFAVERGEELQGWQQNWVEIGLPISALIVASLTYMVLKADPAHKRANEGALAKEKKEAIEANARNAVDTSPAMQTIHERRVWRETVRNLSAEGYDADEIAYMTAHIPELHDLEAARHARAAEQPAAAEQGRAMTWLKHLLNRSADSPSTDTTGDPGDDAMRHHDNIIPTPTTPGQGDGAASRLHPDDIAAIAAALAQASVHVPTPVPHANGQEPSDTHP